MTNLLVDFLDGFIFFFILAQSIKKIFIHMVLTLISHLQAKTVLDINFPTERLPFQSTFFFNYVAITFILFTKRMASSYSKGFLTWCFSSSRERVISNPFGRKGLKPKISSWCSLNNSFTFAMTPLVFILRKYYSQYQEHVFTQKCHKN